MAIETSLAITAKVEESDVALARFNYSLTASLTWTRQVAQRLTVANNAVDQAISLAGCTQADVVFITTTQPLSIKVDGGAAIAINSIMVLSAGATSLTVSNASGSSATVDILILD